MKARVLHTRFWTDEYITGLPIKERYFFLYLITNEHVNLSGVYELPELYMIAATGLKKKEIDGAKRKFQKDGKFVFLKGWVRIVNADRYQVYSGEKNDVAKQKELDLAPEELFDVNRVLIEYPYPSDTSSNQNQSKKQVISNKEYTKDFENFWNDYPRKEGKHTAFISWGKLTDEEKKSAKEALPKHVASSQWKKDGGQFIPHGATWLNNKRWEDEVTSKKSGYLDFHKFPVDGKTE